MVKSYFSRPGVVALLAAYGTIVLVLVLLSASNYPVQWREQVNHERKRYLQVIAQAINYYAADHEGVYPDIPSQYSVIANTNACSAYCPALGQQLPCYDLSSILVPGYMQEILQDPLSTSQTESGFYIRMEGKRVTLGACTTFFDEPIRID